MVKYIFGVLLVMQEFVDLVYVLPNLGQIQRAEILKESFVGEVLTMVKPTLSILKKKAWGMSFGGWWSAR